MFILEITKQAIVKSFVRKTQRFYSVYFLVQDYQQVHEIRVCFLPLVLAMFFLVLKATNYGAVHILPETVYFVKSCLP